MWSRRIPDLEYLAFRVGTESFPPALDAACTDRLKGGTVQLKEETKLSSEVG